jgi:hypothetical protein
MLKYEIIRRNPGEIELKMLIFPPEIEKYFKKEKIFLSQNDMVLGIISKSLYIDGIGSSCIENASLAIPFSTTSRVKEKGTELTHGISRPNVRIRDSYEGKRLVESLVVALNQLCEEVFQCKMLIQLSAPYVYESRPLLQ